MPSHGRGTKEDAAILPPEKATGYPEPTMFGTMPAYSFYIQHVKGLEMSNVEMQFKKEDFRPAYVLDHVSGADFIHIKAQETPGVPYFSLKNTRDLNI